MSVTASTVNDAGDDHDSSSKCQDKKRKLRPLIVRLRAVERMVAKMGFKFGKLWRGRRRCG